MTNRIAQKKPYILNIKVDSTQAFEVLSFVRSSLENHKKFFIVTPNPEIVLNAQGDPMFAKILNSADISLPDGVGLLAANRFFSLPNPKNRTIRLISLVAQGLGIGFSILFDRNWLAGDLKLLRGREIFLELTALANKFSWKVYLLGGEQEEAKGAKRELQKIYKKAKFRAAGGPVLNKNGVPVDSSQKVVERQVVQEINELKPQLLFVGFGAPKQEKWTYRWLPKLSVGGAMVVGGTFKYISGQAKLPPKFFADSGLEWLWRLLTGSQKFQRINAAIFEFPLKIFWKKFQS